MNKFSTVCSTKYTFLTLRFGCKFKTFASFDKLYPQIFQGYGENFPTTGNIV